MRITKVIELTQEEQRTINKAFGIIHSMALLMDEDMTDLFDKLVVNSCDGTHNNYGCPACIEIAGGQVHAEDQADDYYI